MHFGAIVLKAARHYFFLVEGFFLAVLAAFLKSLSVRADQFAAGFTWFLTGRPAACGCSRKDLVSWLALRLRRTAVILAHTTKPPVKAAQ